MDIIALIKAERDRVARQLNGLNAATRSFRGDVQNRIIQTTPENVSSSSRANFRCSESALCKG